MSIYEVSDIHPGESFLARDLILGGDPVRVHENAGTQSMQQWEHFAMRIVEVRGKNNESLRNRGDLTIWITDDARTHWAAPRRGSPGGQRRYSDLAITLCLTIGMVYKLPLRQTQGLMRSISKLMQLDVPVPDFSTLSRRGHGLSLPAAPKTCG